MRGYFILYKNLNELSEGCICLNVLAINLFVHNWPCWRYEGFRNLDPIQTEKMYCVLKIYFLNLSYDEIQIMQEEIYRQNIGANTPFQLQIQVFVMKNML